MTDSRVREALEQIRTRSDFSAAIASAMSWQANASGESYHERRARVEQLLAEAVTGLASEPGVSDVRHPGWIVANSEGDKFRCWHFGPSWTTNRTKALRFARRIDAENFCAEDDDAWKIIEVGDADKSGQLTDEIVSTAMLDAWNDICSDTDCHPLDIEQNFEGKKGCLGFSPKHWARSTALHIRAALSRQQPAAEAGASTPGQANLKAVRDERSGTSEGER